MNLRLWLFAGLALFTVMTPNVRAQTDERVPIQNFEIDVTEVTISQFDAFAAATGLTTQAEKAGGGFEWGAGWERRRGWNYRQPYGKHPGSHEEPAVHVSWDEARAYCLWVGGRLPAVDEWRLAAYTEKREQPADGFETGRTYPYPVGVNPDGMNLQTDDRWQVHAPVGATKRGVNGLFDMGGNVWEWLADRRGHEALTAGGSWWYGASQTMDSGAQWKPAAFYAVYVGFRCAYDLE